MCIIMYHIVSYRNYIAPAIFVGMAEPKVALLIRVTPKLKSRLEEIAESERRSLSKQVELFLERCVGAVNEQNPLPAVPRKTPKKKHPN